MRGLAGKLVDFPALDEGIAAKLPMYCGPGAKDSYTGGANMDFTASLREVHGAL